MCMHWLKYVKLDTEVRLKKYALYDTGNRHASRRQQAYSAISCFYQCLTGPL